MLRFWLLAGPACWALAAGIGTEVPAGADKLVEGLPGQHAVLLSELTAEGPRPLYAVRADERFAVGSSFKLYVLGALIEQVNAGKMRDDQVVRLKKECLGPPSSELADWPLGSPVTLHTLALKMISISDNTATDTLMHVLGRTRVEEMMQAMGHGDVKVNRPCLTTREMVMLRDKGAPDRLKKYQGLDEAGRRALLDTEIAKLRDFDKLDFDTSAFQSAEWFASPMDMAKALDWIRRNTVSDRPGRDLIEVLTVEKKLKADAKRWPYVGFKGGSEDQLICGNWLLRHEDGRWFTFHVFSNNKDGKVDPEKFGGSIQAIFDVLDKGLVLKK